MMDVPILTAVISVTGTLLGAIVGGCLTMYSNFFLNKRRERAELRTGCRLIAVELEEKGAFVSSMLDRKRWSQIDLGQLSTEAWEEHRHVLASYLSAEEWDVVRNAVRAGRYGLIIAATAREDKMEEMDDFHTRLFAELVEDIRRGQTNLQRYLTKPRRQLLKPLRLRPRITRPPVLG
jgi:hypothetical protein